MNAWRPPSGPTRSPVGAPPPPLQPAEDIKGLQCLPSQSLLLMDPPSPGSQEARHHLLHIKGHALHISNERPSHTTSLHKLHLQLTRDLASWLVMNRLYVMMWLNSHSHYLTFSPMDEIILAFPVSLCVFLWIKRSLKSGRVRVGSPGEARVVCDPRHQLVVQFELKTSTLVHMTARHVVWTALVKFFEKVWEGFSGSNGGW